MSVQTQITRLENAKADILAAIVEKGVTVPSAVLLEDVADLIRQISQSIEADNRLSVDTDDGTSGYLTHEGEYLTLTFN